MTVKRSLQPGTWSIQFRLAFRLPVGYLVLERLKMCPYQRLICAVSEFYGERLIWPYPKVNELLDDIRALVGDIFPVPDCSPVDRLFGAYRFSGGLFFS